MGGGGWQDGAMLQAPMTYNDRAIVMSDKSCEVRVLIRHETNPNALHVHCVAHNINCFQLMSPQNTQLKLNRIFSQF